MGHILFSPTTLIVLEYYYYYYYYYSSGSSTMHTTNSYTTSSMYVHNDVRVCTVVLCAYYAYFYSTRVVGLEYAYSI